MALRAVLTDHICVLTIGRLGGLLCSMRCPTIELRAVTKVLCSASRALQCFVMSQRCDLVNVVLYSAADGQKKVDAGRARRAQEPEFAKLEVLYTHNSDQSVCRALFSAMAAVVRPQLSNGKTGSLALAHRIQYMW